MIVCYLILDWPLQYYVQTWQRDYRGLVHELHFMVYFQVPLWVWAPLCKCSHTWLGAWQASKLLTWPGDPLYRHSQTLLRTWWAFKALYWIGDPQYRCFQIWWEPNGHPKSWPILVFHFVEAPKIVLKPDRPPKSWPGMVLHSTDAPRLGTWWGSNAFTWPHATLCRCST